ncbi:hypothetical protein [Mesorhizobium sp. M0138]|uniref:hypothetical protein n=1 Tax=Mesorhizobium sp. M0138 TaxID=2956891 RepID=UPI00333C1041
MATQAMNRSSTAAFSGGSASTFRQLSERERMSIHRLIVRDIETEWSEQVMAKLNELVALPTGWDGYSGSGVTFEIAHFSANLLQSIFVPDAPIPSLVPGSDGSMQIEWHAHGFDIELDVIAVNQVMCLRRDVASGVELELFLETDFKEVRSWMIELADRASHAVSAAA